MLGKALAGISYLLCFAAVHCNHATLVNNGYKGVVVAIAPYVAENAELVDKIKAMMTDASENMYHATRKRAYFNEITILVPKTWTTGSYGLAGNETFDSADIIIDKPHPAAGHNPYARVFVKCGMQGLFIHLTPEFVVEDRFLGIYGQKGKVVVHEWGHYRWGVFDEYGTSKDTLFYLSERGVEATRCSANFAGEIGGRDCVYDARTRLPLSGCNFYPASRQPDGMTTSYMSHQFHSAISTFCHNDLSDPLNVHNTDAPNNQNRICNKKSTWDVILETGDFRGGNNPENPRISDTTPKFFVVKAGIKRLVLVMDVSGSMSGQKLVNMREAAELLISNFASDGIFIGLVAFSSDARTLMELTRLGDGDSSREKLVSVLPRNAVMGTGIGSGILEGIEVLEGDGSQARGGELVVLTDGEETTGPFVSSIADQVKNEGVKIHSIFFGLSDINAAASLRELSDATGGQWYYASGAELSPDLIQIFQAVAKAEDGDTVTQSVLLRSEVTSVENGTAKTSKVAIDSTVGNRTAFVFSWLEDHANPPRIDLKTPKTNCYYSNYNTSSLNFCSDKHIHSMDPSSKTIKFVIPGTAEVGEWQYTIQNEKADNYSVAVTSSPSREDIRPLVVESRFESAKITGKGPAVLYVRVQQGYAPVINASVTAYITTPDESVIEKVLFDNGAGADGLKDDGTYSGYFVQFDSQGRYSVQVKATAQNITTTSIGQLPQSAPNLGYVDENGNVVTNQDALDELNAMSSKSLKIDGPFERVVTGGGLAFSGEISDGDEMPPNKVTDLRAFQSDLDDVSKGVTLVFSAPGDDYDVGQVSRYEIGFTYDNPLILRDDFASAEKINASFLLEGNLQSTKAAPEREKFVVRPLGLPSNGTSVRISFAVRAFDDVGNPSESPSNIATTTFFKEPPPVPGSSSRPLLHGFMVMLAAVLVVLQQVVV